MLLMCRWLTLLMIFVLQISLSAQSPTPAPPQTGAILIFGAAAHLGNGQVIPNSAIAFENGKLTLVADATAIRIDRSRFAKIFDAAGKHVYPGFIATDSRLGLVEIDPGHHSPLHRHRCEEVYYVVKGSGELESDGVRRPISAGCAVLNRPGVSHRVYNTGDETIQLVVVAGIMFVPLWPQWPTASPYEVFEGSSMDEHRPAEAVAAE